MVELEPGTQVAIFEGIEDAQMVEYIDLSTGHAHEEDEDSSPCILLGEAEEDAAESEHDA